MAANKKTLAGSSRSPKKTVKATAGSAASKPVPKKAPAQKKKPLKTTLSRQPVKAVKNPTSSKQKPATAAKPAKKAASKTTPTTKIAPAAVASKTKRVNKPVNKVAVPPPKAAAKAALKPAAPVDPKKPQFNKGDLHQFKLELLAMRDRITGQSGAMRDAALQRTDEINPEEDGTDAFMRLQTLEQVSSQQQLVTNIDESLRLIEKGSYGVCGQCGGLISKPRLTVLPFAKNCIKCQSEMERQHRPGGRR